MNQNKSIIHKGYEEKTLKPYIGKRMYSTGLQISEKQYNQINKWKTYKVAITDLKVEDTINNLVGNF